MKHLLTQRELEILELLAKGKSRAEIADKSFISTHTIKNHLSAIFRKLGVHDAVGAIGLVFLPSENERIISLAEYNALQAVVAAARADPDPTARVREALAALEQIGT